MSNKPLKISVAKIAAGAVISVLLCLLLLLGATAVTVNSGSVPYDLMPFITTAILSVSSFFGAFAVCAASKSNGLITGAGAGVILLLCLLIAGALLGGDAPSLITKGAAAVAAGGIGGILGVNKKSRFALQ